MLQSDPYATAPVALRSAVQPTRVSMLKSPSSPIGEDEAFNCPQLRETYPRVTPKLTLRCPSMLNVLVCGIIYSQSAVISRAPTYEVTGK